MALLAKLAQQRGQLGLGQGVDEVGRRRAPIVSPPRAHAHVERPVGAEREAAPGLVELERRDAEVEHHAIECCHPPPGEVVEQVAEVPLREVQPARVGGGERRAAGDGVGVAVEREDGAAAVEQRRRVAAAAEGAVEDPRARPRRQMLQHLVEQDGDVAAHGTPFPDLAAASARPRARAA